MKYFFLTLMFAAVLGADGFSQSFRHHGQDAVVIGDDFILPEGETAQDVVVIAGRATIHGTVNGDLVVVLGSVKLGPGAEVKRDFVVVGGAAEVDPAVKVRGDRVNIGWGPNWESNPWLLGFKQWIEKGLLWGRILPHQFVWTGIVAGIFLLLYLLLALLFPRPVAASVEALATRPGSSFLLGLLTFLLIGPLLFLLAISIIGLVIVPFLICGLIAAYVFGKLAIYCYTGQQLGAQTGWSALQKPILALLVGALLFYLLYAIPVLGLLVWGAIAPLGLGAVLLAFFSRFRREAKTQGRAGEGTLPSQFTGEHVAPRPGDLAFLPRAGFWIRFLATAIDFALIAMIVAMVMRLHPKLFIPIWVIYHVTMWSWRGTTIGGVVLGLKIIRTDGSPINFPIALVRSLASFLSAAVLFIGFFWAGWSAERQSWHDKIAGTLVVRWPKGVSLFNPAPRPEMKT